MRDFSKKQPPPPSSEEMLTVAIFLSEYSNRSFELSSRLHSMNPGDERAESLEKHAKHLAAVADWIYPR